MQVYKEMLRGLTAGVTYQLRPQLGMTQEEMAEQLRISCRAYGDLERGKYCFSAQSLLFLMLLMRNEQIVELLDCFRRKVCLLEQNNVAR